jgi:hypothetical protein
MRRHVAAVAFLLLPVVAGTVWEWTRSDRPEPSLRELAPLLLDLDVIRAEHEYLLRTAVTDAARALGLPQPLRVNQPCASNAICVYVVDVHALEQMARVRRQTVLATIARALQDNCIAVPPNTILIDKDFLGRVLLYAMNDFLAYSQATLEAQNAKTDEEQDAAFARAQTMGSLLQYLRLHNIADARANADRASLDFIASNDPEEAANPVLRRALFPIVAHELAHLRVARPGSFTNGIADFINAQLQAVTRREEAVADAMALRAVEAELRRADVPHTGDPVIDLLGVNALAYTLRDEVFVDLFSGFRGLAAHDLLVALMPKNCEEVEGPRDILNPEHLRTGGLRELPLFTPREWRALRERTAREFRLASHGHRFMRAEEMLRPLHDQLPEAERALAPAKILIAALTENRPELIWRHARTSTTGLTMEQVSFGLGTATQAIGGSGFILNFADGGYLELVGAADDLESATLVVHLVNPGLPQDIQLRSLEQQTQFLTNCFPEMRRDPSSIFRQLFDDDRGTCLNFNRERTIAGRKVVAVQMNDSQYLSLTVLPP